MPPKTIRLAVSVFTSLLVLCGCSSDGNEPIANGQPVAMGAGGGAANNTMGSNVSTAGQNAGGTEPTTLGGAPPTGGKQGSAGSSAMGGAAVGGMGTSSSIGGSSEMTASGGMDGIGGSSEMTASGGMDGLGGMGGSGGVGGSNVELGGAGGAPELMETPDIHAVVPSTGCGKPAFAPEGKWQKQPALDIDGRQRNWHVRVPDNYDPKRAYPIIFKFHGCGGKDNNTPIERVSGRDAITVRGESVAKCWNDLATGNVTNETESFDLPFVDAMLDYMKENSCVDSNRVFGIGYSSGGWTATILACKRANVFRALGSIAGADWVHMNQLDAPKCSEGHVARMFISDTDDNGSNRWDNHKSAEARLVERNGCTPGSATPVDPAPCERYEGCGDYPIQHCRTMGAGHGRQDGYAPGAFWKFFTEFLPKSQ